jgi:hypothetical protein
MANTFHSATMLAAISLIALAGCGGGSGGVTPPPAAPVLSQKPILLSKGVTMGSAHWPDRSTATGGRGLPVAGVSCLVTEDYHIHTHLAIIKNGAMLAIPKDVGLQGCAYELHTHDQSGILHIETATNKKFTLGQFFSVWGQPLAYDNIAGITGLPVAVFVNDGTGLVECKGDLATLELTNHRAITIQVGTALAEIPSYQWSADL